MENNAFVRPARTGIASDHAGYWLKTFIIEKLKEWNCEYTDYGTDSENSVDYPDFGHRLGKAIENGECETGIAICYSGNGIGIVLNRHRGVRAALCWNKDVAILAKQHNDANVCVLPAHFVANEEAGEIVSVFFSTPFEGGRHIRRIEKINSGLQR
ncbi:MAG: RpiB/LacA/LacB family sugar-phosphate isomerase [Prevotellaceae bacterium]|jgi:ribose 5-phosphate isomerase B|nr:RpiB/LacA/LacB family sugar-phosphate isomerase [Prevotellaceae bacterium]